MRIHQPPSVPRGSWFGKATGHPQVIVVAPSTSTSPVPGASVKVDEELAPVLLALWRLGLPTEKSCQNATDAEGEESGEAHIHFLAAKSAKRFVAIIGDGITYRPWPRSTGTSVAFPTERLPEIVALLGREMAPTPEPLDDVIATMPQRIVEVRSLMVEYLRMRQFRPDIDPATLDALGNIQAEMAAAAAGPSRLLAIGAQIKA